MRRCWKGILTYVKLMLKCANWKGENRSNELVALYKSNQHMLNCRWDCDIINNNAVIWLIVHLIRVAFDWCSQAYGKFHNSCYGRARDLCNRYCTRIQHRNLLRTLTNHETAQTLSLTSYTLLTLPLLTLPLPPFLFFCCLAHALICCLRYDNINAVVFNWFSSVDWLNWT